MFSSKACMTTKFAVEPNVGIDGHTSKTLTDVSSESCTRACVMEKSFDCKSVNYRPSQRTCQLSSVDRNTPNVKLTNGGDFQGWLYQEKKCGSYETTKKKV